MQQAYELGRCVQDVFLVVFLFFFPSLFLFNTKSTRMLLAELPHVFDGSCPLTSSRFWGHVTRIHPPSGWRGGLFQTPNIWTCQLPQTCWRIWVDIDQPQKRIQPFVHDCHSTGKRNPFHLQTKEHLYLTSAGVVTINRGMYETDHAVNFYQKSACYMSPLRDTNHINNITR